MEYIRPPEDIPIHCPFCGRELKDSPIKYENLDGWYCECGEYIPVKLAYDPFSGGRERIEPHFERKQR